MEYPNISIITPIYQRNKFKRLIISNLINLDYPLDKIEYIIDDDGKEEKFINNIDELNEFKEAIYPIKFIYKHYERKREIGEKRNNLVKLATNKLIGQMDSDDFMMSSWLKYGIDEMNKNKTNLVGSNQMLFIFPNNDWKTTGIQCGEKRMIHEAGMIFKKRHWKAMGGFKKSSQGEGTNMIDGMNPKTIGLLDCNNVMICICHSSNTINKDRFLDQKDFGLHNQLTDYDKDLILSSIS
jgi:glycosyltransferase involved in cell wall biosynthesis